MYLWFIFIYIYVDCRCFNGINVWLHRFPSTLLFFLVLHGLSHCYTALPIKLRLLLETQKVHTHGPLTTKGVKMNFQRSSGNQDTREDTSRMDHRFGFNKHTLCRFLLQQTESHYLSEIELYVVLIAVKAMTSNFAWLGAASSQCIRVPRCTHGKCSLTMMLKEWEDRASKRY